MGKKWDDGRGTKMISGNTWVKNQLITIHKGILSNGKHFLDMGSKRLPFWYGN